MAKQGKHIFESSKAVTDETFYLWIATSWMVVRDYA